MQCLKRRGFFHHAAVIAVFAFSLIVFTGFAAGTATVQAATHTVTNTNDSGSGSLRQAVADAASGDVITFALDYPATITLTEVIPISKDLTIQGPDSGHLTVSGGDNCRVFEVSSASNISNLTIANGYDDDKGGGMYTEASSVTVRGCTFLNNSVATDRASLGGGVYNDEGSPTFINCTFTDNTASDSGGGMYNYNSNVTVTNCTFTGNTAARFGCAMYTFAVDTSPTVTNCIFWGNKVGDTKEIDGEESSFTYCVISDDLDGYGEHNINTDPLLQDLADNGGPTNTCALGLDSSAIDAGETVAVSDDQRGVSRPQKDGFDIGAYELGYYEISVSAIDLGDVTYQGREVDGESVYVYEGQNAEFKMIPGSGFQVDKVEVDGERVSYETANNTYTFENVSGDHSLFVEFGEERSLLGGCNASAFPGIALLLATPLAFLLRKKK